MTDLPSPAFAVAKHVRAPIADPIGGRSVAFLRVAVASAAGTSHLRFVLPKCSRIMTADFGRIAPAHGPGVSESEDCRSTASHPLAHRHRLAPRAPHRRARAPRL